MLAVHILLFCRLQSNILRPENDRLLVISTQANQQCIALHQTDCRLQPLIEGIRVLRPVTHTYCFCSSVDSFWPPSIPSAPLYLPTSNNAFDMSSNPNSLYFSSKM